MTRKEPKNVVASVLARLREKAKSSVAPFQQILQQYAIERFLYRVSKSKHAQGVVLKGALLLKTINFPRARPTMDIDMLRRGKADQASLIALVEDCANLEVEADGLCFLDDSIVTEEITKDSEYKGTRVLMDARMDNVRLRIQIDFGVGDVMVPGPRMIESPILSDRLNQQFLLGARNQAFLTEYISGMETLKSLQMEPQLKNQFGDFLATYMDAGFKTKQLGNTYSTVANLLEQLMTLAILCYGAYLVMHDTAFTIGMLVAFQMFAGRLSQPVLRLVGLWQQFQQANISVQRLGDLMNAPAEPYTVVPQREGGGAGQVEVRDVAFRYAEHLPFLYQNFNLTVRTGQCVALMGPSGSGKSTLAKLLQGFYWPSGGQILVDGRDTRYLSANELRQNFGVVPQETMLFSGSIYQNLALANSQASFEQIVQACRMAEIHDVIEKLPHGYQTQVGERGVGLSGGQKQRIAIARALLKRPKVLIFDEAISSLDQQTAEQFSKTINALKGRVTILFITHQLPRSLRFDAVHEIGRAAGDEKHFEVIQGGAPERHDSTEAPRE